MGRRDGCERLPSRQRPCKSPLARGRKIRCLRCCEHRIWTSSHHQGVGTDRVASNREHREVGLRPFKTDGPEEQDGRHLEGKEGSRIRAEGEPPERTPGYRRVVQESMTRLELDDDSSASARRLSEEGWPLVQMRNGSRPNNAQ